MSTKLAVNSVAHSLQLRAEGLAGFESIILTNGAIGLKAISLKLPCELFPYIQPGDPGLVVTLSVVRIAVEEVQAEPTSGLILPGVQ